MAGLQFSSGIDKGFENDLKRMNKQMNNFAGNVQKQSSFINNSFKDIATTIGGIATVGALARAGKQVVTFSSDLADSLTEVSTISQAVTDDFEGYKNSILELSKTSATGAKELSDSFYDIVSAGYDGAAGLELLTTAEKASTAGFVDVGIAADGLTTVLNAWGKSADEAGKISDVFFKTVEKGKTTFPELGSNISQVAPLAASLGVSFEEVQAAVATITKSGVPTSQAFTQIRSALVGMNESLGDGWAQSMTLQEGFQEIYKRANGSATGVQALVGRVEGMNAVLALSGKNAKVAAEDLAAMNDALGATEVAADKVIKLGSQQAKILGNNILAAFEPLGAKAVETFAKLAASLNEAFESGDVEKYTKILGTLIAALGAWKISIFAVGQAQKINTVLTNLNSAAQKTAAITGKSVTVGNYLMAKSFKSLKAAFASNPIGILVTGLTLAIPLITSFVDSQSELNKETGKLNSEIQKEQKESNKLFEALKKTNPKSEERTDIIKQLNEKYPDLLKNYNLDVAGLKDIEKAQDAVNKKIIETIALRSQEEKIQKAAEKLYENQTSILNLYLQSLSKSADKGSLSSAFSRINSEISKEGANSIEIAKEIANELGIAIQQGAEQTIISQGTAGATTTTTYQSSQYELLLGFVNKLTDANKDYLTTQKEIEDFTKAFIGGESVLNKSAEIVSKTVKENGKLTVEEQEKQRKEAVKQLELDNQARINEITKQYGGEEALEKDFNTKMLQNRLLYLDQLSKLTTDQLEKLKIEEEKINIGFDLAGKGKSQIEQLELNYKKELLLLKNKYKDEDKFRKKALEAEKKYIKNKLELTTDENEKIELQIRLDTINYTIDEGLKAEELGQRKRIDVIKEAQAKILKLEKQLQDDITVYQAQEIQKQIDNQKGLLNNLGIGNATNNTDGIDSALQSSLKLIGDVMGEASDEISKVIGNLVTNIGSVVSTLGDKDASSFSKASGLVSLAIAGGKELAKIRDEAYASEIESQRSILENISEQISLERSISKIRQDRIDESLQSNVFLDASYIDVATNAVKKQQTAYSELNDSLTALSQNAIITSKGSAKRRLFGTKTDSYDFSIEQILSDYVTNYAGEAGIGSMINPLQGNIQAFQKGDFFSQLQSFLDPAGIFGGYATGKAQQNALENIRDTFTDTLELMGKTSEDIANLSSEEWLDFFTILDEAGKIQDEATKQLLANAQESLEAYKEAITELEGVISDLAGSLGDTLADSIVNAIATGEDALDNFSKSFDDVLLEMAKSTANQLFFKDLFDTLQEEMKQSVTDGDNNWQDDLLRFYDKLPSAINGAQDFLTDFDNQLQNLGFEGITSTDAGSQSSANKISEAITEQTGTELLGRINAVMLHTSILRDNSNDMLSYAVKNLVTLNAIKENTDYLPQIAKYTKATADKL